MPERKYNRVFFDNGVLLKKCCDCNKIKPVSEFSRRRRNYAFHCKDCKSIWAKKRNVERRALGPDSDAYKAYSRKERDRTLKRRYGISLIEYERLQEEQAGLCALCGEHETSKSNKSGMGFLVLDHDHETGNRRKLLCRACNHGLGNFKDSPSLLLKAIEYLRHHGRR